MTEVLAPALQAGQRLDVLCGRMVHGGLCVARSGHGAAVLVAGAIPGETVTVALRYRKGRTWFADTVAVTEPSPHRQAVPCPYVPECGGCQLQHVAYGHQLTLKREIVLDALRRQRVSVPANPAVIGMGEPWRYRWRGEFHVVSGADGMRDAGLGFNRARSWRPIAVDDCVIHDARITRAIPVLRDMVRHGAGTGLRTLHVTLGGGGGELLLRAKPPNALAAPALEDAALHLPGEQVLSTEATSLSWRGHTYRVTPDTFIQVNQAQMDALYGCVVQALSDLRGSSVVDAYAGVGILPVHLAAAEGMRVTCIESNRSAARMGALNARLNGVEARMRYVMAAAEEALPREAGAEAADAVILDPPRAGCAGAVTAWLALAGPERVVYASCDPATLARDLHVLITSGPYELRDLAIVDMFPQTYHIETVATLTRRTA